MVDSSLPDSARLLLGHPETKILNRESGTIPRLRVTLAPIRILPTELLIEIFALVALCDDKDIYQHSFSRREVVLLSQVCMLWSQIVRKTPRLWRKCLDIERDESKKFSNQEIHMIQTWLARSAPIPIPIRIYCYAPDIEAVLRSLFPSANRWESLVLECPALSCLADLPPGSLGMLQRLRLGHPREHYRKELTTLNVFLSAQRLREVTLCVMNTLKLPMPWQQLTSLCLNDDCPDTCREILTKCTNIVKATIITMAWPLNTQMPRLPITVLPQLETLRISFNGTYPNSPAPGNLAHFFKPLALPVLKELELSCSPDNESGWPCLTFTEFQRRSPNIEQFISFTPLMKSDDLAVLLRHAPTLRRLSLAECWSCVDENLCNALRYREDDVEPLAPALEVLTLRDIDKNVSRSCAEALIKSRWWSDEELLAMTAPPKVARWKAVYLHVYGVVYSNDFKSWMKVAKTQGLRVSLSRFWE